MRRLPAWRLAGICLLGVAALVAPVAAPADQAQPGRLYGVLAPHTQAATAGQGVPLLRPVPVAPPRARQRPDVLVTAPRPIPPATVARLAALTAAADNLLPVRVGTLRVGTAELTAWGVDPARFRSFTPKATAESDGVWDCLADGDMVLAHAAAQGLDLALGGPVSVTSGSDALPRSIRLGALATSGLPGVAVLLSDQTAAAHGFPAATGALLSAGLGDPRALALAARQVVGSAATVRQLSPSHRPVAVLHGGPAEASEHRAKQGAAGVGGSPLGSFSYRYFANGTIAPDPAWVRANIVTADVPILGSVRCHRLMIPQLRAALAEVQSAGLAGSIHRGQYAGCYNPRFIDRDPGQPISLHTWGIALDLNVPGNLRGTRGEIDRRVVTIFKRWGFAWGGDWAYTDPMHFELSTLVTPR